VLKFDDPLVLNKLVPLKHLYARKIMSHFKVLGRGDDKVEERAEVGFIAEKLKNFHHQGST
jgi:hypothetical protein